MKGTVLIAILAIGLSGGYGALAKTTAPSTHMNQHAHVLVTPVDLKWAAAPDSLPPGAQIAVLEGDPTKSGPFTMRARFPANYHIRPHWHPADEHVTVISGALYMGLGDTFDESRGKALPAGGFAVMPRGVRHYAWTTADTVIQIHGIGPWGITYVNLLDDPRNKQASRPTSPQR